MKKHRYSSILSNNTSNYKVKLTVIEFKEDDNTIMFAPALDICGYGKNTAEAKQSFGIVLEEFINHTSNKNTLNTVLNKLGWGIND